VLEILKRVEVAEAVEEPMAKRVVAVSPLLALMESFANGVVEPTPTLPAPGLISVFPPNGFITKSAAAPVVKAIPCMNPLFAPVLFPTPISTPEDDCDGETPICTTAVFTVAEVLPPRIERSEFGDVVPTPIFPLEATKSEEVPMSELEPLKYATCPRVPLKSDEVAIEIEFPAPSSTRDPERPRPKVTVEVAAVLRVPLFPYMTPESEPSFGALVKVLVPPKVLLSPRSVVDATVIDEPRETLVPLIVMDEFVRPALDSVPVMFGVPKVKVPPLLVMV
jgi:hypothetical protein